MFPARDTDQSGEVCGVLGDIPHQHPLASGAAMPAVVQRVGDQAGLPEAQRDMVVTAGGRAAPAVGEPDRSWRDVRRPDVVDDAHAADAVEMPFSPGRNHYGQRNGSWGGPLILGLGDAAWAL